MSIRRPGAYRGAKSSAYAAIRNSTSHVLRIRSFLLQNGGNLSTIDLDSTCRFYDIGRTKRVGEEESDEEPVRF